MPLTVAAAMLLLMTSAVTAHGTDLRASPTLQAGQRIALAEREIAALSRQADNLQSLIAKMEQDLKTAAKAAVTASLQGTPVSPNGKPNLGALKDRTRHSPAIAFASGRLPLAASCASSSK